jgi:hypothetical protein
METEALERRVQDLEQIVLKHFIILLEFHVGPARMEV